MSKYTIDNHTDKTIFDGNLEEYLLHIGVKSEHIEKMKNTVNEENRDGYYFRSTLERKKKLVPLDKVIGMHRPETGKTIFEIVNGDTDGNIKYKQFDYWFDLVEATSLEETRNTFSNLHQPVDMTYYVEEDKYYLSGDGNHRTLMALLLGAEYIIANVQDMHCDFEKKDKYYAAKAFYDKYSIVKIVKNSYGNYYITFNMDGEHINIYQFDCLHDRMSCYEIIDTLSDEIDKDLFLANVCSHFPIIIINLIMKITKRERLEQYIRKYGKERIGLGFGESIVKLYEL